MRSARREAAVCAGIVFLAALFLYSWTLAPTVTLVDSGELIVAAHSLGVAHPPGFPLYIMLTHLASLVPIGSVAARVNFASALFAALASAILTLVATESMSSASPLVTGEIHKKDSDETRANSRLLLLVPPLGTGLLFAFSRTLWSYATITEVYTLNTLLIVFVIFLILRWRRRQSFTPKRNALLYISALTFGFALGVHHVTVALTLPALALLVYRTEGARFFASLKLLFTAFLSLAGLIVVYSYLPWASSGGGVMKWGMPHSLREIWWHISGRQYQSFFSFSPDLIGRQLSGLVALVLRQFGPWWFPLALFLAILGFANAWKRDRTIFWFLALLVLSNMAYTSCYDIAEDKDAYYLPVFIALALAIGFGLRSVIEFAVGRNWPAPKAYVFAGFLVLLVLGVTLTSNWTFNNRRNYFIGQDYVENIQGTIAPHGLLLTLDWQVQSPMLYTREIEQARRDLKIIDINLLRRSWYFDYLGRAYPEILARSRAQVDSFLSDLRQWEQSPQDYQKDWRLAQRIESTFHEMLRSFVTEENKVAPVYVTSEIMFHTNGSNALLTEWLLRNFQPIPRGLVFELTTDRGFHDPGEIHLETRGLADGTLRFEKEDVVMLKVIPAYVQMLGQRGRYLALFGQHDRAIAAFEQALALDPNSKSTQIGLNESKKQLPVSSLVRPN